MSAKFEYISESDRKAICLAKKVLKRLQKRCIKLDNKAIESVVDFDKRKSYRFTLWRMYAELDWLGINVDYNGKKLSITV